MDKRTKGCLWIGLGLTIALAMVAVVLLAGGAYWAYQSFSPSAQFVDQETADQRFADIRTRFKDQAPMIVHDADGHGASVRPHDRPPFTGELQTLHVAAYDPRARKLVRFSVPFWLLRMGRDGKITVNDGPLHGIKGADRLTVKEIEALGPGLLFDESKGNGDHVLVWTE